MINCLRPVRIRVENKHVDVSTGELNSKDVKIYVPCGKCPLCQSRKANDWSFRLYQTWRFSHDSYFITLTYDNDHIPKYDNNGLSNVQKFLKRLRKNYGLSSKTGFKYYLISELGGKLGRLHYHALFFNTGMTWDEMRIALNKTWKAGRISVDSINRNRIYYVSKYCLQNVNKPAARLVRRHSYLKFQDGTTGFLQSEDIVKEKPVNFFFMTCSKGIGLEFLTQPMIKYLRQNPEFTTIYRNKERAVPSYYLKKVFTDDEAEYYRVKEYRLQKTIEASEDEQRIANEYYDKVVTCGRKGLKKPPLPDEWQERNEKARRVSEARKKYNFSEPPRGWWNDK